MTARPANSIHVSETDARLRNRQRVGRWLNGTGSDMRLKISNGGDGQVNIIPPTCKHRVGVDADVFPVHKKTEKSLPHGVLQGFSTLFESVNKWCTDEGVLILRRVATGISRLVAGPKPKRGNSALLPNIAVVVKDG